MTSVPTAIAADLASRRDAFLADLRSLVDVDCGTDNKAGVDAVGALVCAYLERDGFAAETIPVTTYGDCVVGRLHGAGRARILLLGHLDTVFPIGTAAERPMSIRDGRVHGPGANDMKAGLLAGLYGVGALLRSGFRDFAEVALFCNSDEEIGSPASRELYADLARAADAALILEAAREDGSIVSARKGGAHLVVTVTGLSAHAGAEPHKGANAVHSLARMITALEELNGLRPGTTVSTCAVQGGTRSNVVPDRAEAHVDVRFLLPDDVPVIEGVVRTIVGHPVVPGTSATVEGGYGNPMPKTTAVRQLLKLARGVAGELGFEIADVTSGGISDGNKVAALGTPVLDGLGPVGGLDHGPGEYVEIDSIVPRAALVGGLVHSIATHVDEVRAARA